MVDRLACCVPFCRRTTKADFSEWVCCDHWRIVPRALRAEYAAAKRKARKIIARKPAYREWWTLPAGSSDRFAAIGLWRRLNRMWERCKAAAIEGAAGL